MCSNVERCHENTDYGCKPQPTSESLYHSIAIFRIQTSLLYVAMIVKDEVFETGSKAVLEAFGVELSVTEKRNRKRQVEYFLVDHGNVVVVSAHQAVCNIVCVHALLGLSLHFGAIQKAGKNFCGLGVGIAQAHQPLDNPFPRDRLEVCFRNLKKCIKELVYMPQSAYICDVTEDRGEPPENKDPQHNVL